MPMPINLDGQCGTEWPMQLGGDRGYCKRGDNESYEQFALLLVDSSLPLREPRLDRLPRGPCQAVNRVGVERQPRYERAGVIGRGSFPDELL